MRPLSPLLALALLSGCAATQGGDVEEILQWTEPSCASGPRSMFFAPVRAALAPVDQQITGASLSFTSSHPGIVEMIPTEVVYIYDIQDPDHFPLNGVFYALARTYEGDRQDPAWDFFRSQRYDNGTAPLWFTIDWTALCRTEGSLPSEVWAAVTDGSATWTTRIQLLAEEL